MKTKISFAILSLALIVLYPLRGTAQQKAGDQAKGKQTITIHVTREVDGNKIVIDTTVVTDGDFDADKFLEEKGVMNDLPMTGKKMEKNIIIRRPGEEFGWSDSKSNAPETFIFKGDSLIVDNEEFDFPAPPTPHSMMPFDFNFNLPGEFPYSKDRQIEDMLQGMARSLGLENVMPFGDMKQVVVKKKRNGKKVIITFEDREGKPMDESRRHKKEEKVYFYNNGGEGMAPLNEDKTIINEQTGEKIIIRKNVKKTANGDQVIINAEVENPSPVKKEKKVIIITEEGTK